jgi:hypothetical protein
MHFRGTTVLRPAWAQVRAQLLLGWAVETGQLLPASSMHGVAFLQ